MTLLVSAPAPALEPSAEAAAVVTAFNGDLTARDLGKALAHLAAGGVQFNLRPSHAGLPDPQAASQAAPQGTASAAAGAPPAALTSDLRAHWQMIGPVLFASTTAYSRKVTVVDSRAREDLATVWTRTVTESSRAGQAAPRRDSFDELYLLVRKDGRWLIAGIADDRKPNDVGLGK